MDEIILKWVGKFMSALKNGVTSIFGKLMSWLGLSFVNFEVVLPEVKGYLESLLSRLPDTALNLIGATAFDVFLVLIISALVAKAGLRTITTSVAKLEALIAQQGGT